MKKLLFLFLILPGIVFAQASMLDDGYTQFLIKQFSLPANSAGYLYNDGSGGLSWGALDLSPYVRKDGTTELTADWNVGAFDLTCVDMNATNFKLSGTGTLASTLGNVSLTTSLTAASGDEVGFYLPVTVNKAAGNYTAFKINATETSAPGTADLLLDLQVKTTSKVKVSNAGVVYATDGAYNAVVYSSIGYATSGLGIYSSGPSLIHNGTAVFYGGTSGMALPYKLTLGSGAKMIGLANELQLGEDAAAPDDQTLKAADGVGTDKPGAMLTNQGGASTGTGAPGGWRVQTSTVAGTGSTANTYYDRIRAVGKVYSLANNTATDAFSIAVADGNAVGGRIEYTIEVTDGTDFQIESGIATFAAVNKATETWTTDVDKGTLSQAVSGGTLTVTWAADTATADTLKLTVNSNSNLTPTSTTLRYQIILNSPKVITIL